ncbi:sulfatase family protein [Nonomuraea gerenzanensis]|uniref:Choline-sulfatase n=1 Tax=Nonomuraea gerenzanensis TaxID=93944 RepID=A0A1M4ELJ6_9ACTN|nr:sulfatase [Nonomuraea gerenzanensis]UBU11241.1 sulfatase [Nonomuraea gerenzanensis]SBO99715.1 Choline-sulfatase [Nonomuraea gerenzanensis]
MLKVLCRLACLLLLLPAAEPTIAQGDSRPNIVLILADDLETGTLPLFPNISRHLVGQGASFDRFFVTNSWCCPSRASILRSQHVHSHGVLTNTAPEGGFDRFHTSNLERSTVGTWMQQAGYRTGLMGKFLNHYPGETAEETYVPPGWDEWAVPVRKLYDEYGYRLNENGVPRDYGWEEEDYLSDVLARKARDFITDSDEPFFLYLAPIGPHNPANPAHRHAHAFPLAMVPRTPSFNQTDVSNEPLWLRDRPALGLDAQADVDEHYRRRLRAMLGVDDLVGSVIDALRESGELDDTYVFFTSDNGFHLGTHRLKQGKTTPFEEAVRVPMVVRGPGVTAGLTVAHLGATIDLAPTFAELGGATMPAFAEGRSLVPLLRGRPPSQWRRHVLVEFTRPANRSSAAQTPVPAYQALRTEQYTYVKYETGERQLYDLTTDPYQLSNLAATADPGLITALDRRLAAMAACSGASCRQADSQG